MKSFISKLLIVEHCGSSLLLPELCDKEVIYFYCNKKICGKKIFHCYINLSDNGLGYLNLLIRPEMMINKVAKIDEVAPTRISEMALTTTAIYIWHRQL